MWGRVEGDAGNATMLLATTFEAATTGYAIFDEGALATVYGSSAPPVQLLTFACELRVPPRSGAQSCSGLVAIDAEGSVVWHAPAPSGFETLDDLVEATWRDDWSVGWCTPLGRLYCLVRSPRRRVFVEQQGNPSCPLRPV